MLSNFFPTFLQKSILGGGEGYMNIVSTCTHSSEPKLAFKACQRPRKIPWPLKYRDTEKKKKKKYMKICEQPYEPVRGLKEINAYMYRTIIITPLQMAQQGNIFCFLREINAL
jgi:ribosomal protein L24E